MEKLKVDYSDLDPNETRQAIVDHDAAMTGNVNYPTPTPDAAASTALIARTGTAISKMATADTAWDTAKAELDNATAAGHAFLNQRATGCNSATPGDKVKLTTTKLPLVGGPRTPTGPTPRVLNLSLSNGDVAGSTDVSWDSLLRLARIYELQYTTTMTPDPANAPWLNATSVTKSSTTVGPFTSGSRIWVRVRAIGPNGPGDWSDPATTIVS